MIRNSLFLVALLSLFFTSESIAQETKNREYFRIFTVNIEGLTADEREVLEKAYQEKRHISIDGRSNPPTNAIVLKVSANYPKRVRDIKTELENLAKSQIPQNRVGKVEENKQQE